MPKLTNVDTHYVNEVAVRHQKIGWTLGILYAHNYDIEQSSLTKNQVAQLIQTIHELVTGEKE